MKKGAKVHVTVICTVLYLSGFRNRTQKSFLRVSPDIQLRPTLGGKLLVGFSRGA